MHPFIGNVIIELNDNVAIISNNRSKDDDVEEIFVVILTFINTLSITALFSVMKKCSLLTL